MAASRACKSSSLVPETPTLLTLPLELRLHIYSYLLPPTLSFNHCIHKAEARLPLPKGVPRPSPLKSYLVSRHLISQWCRSHGLHLLSSRSPSKLREEFTAYFYHISPRLEVHCPKGCLDQLLDHLIRHLCIARKFPLVREVWIRVDPNHSRRDFWDHSLNRTLRSLLDDFRQTVAKWYGHFGLLNPKNELPQALTMDWNEDGQEEEEEGDEGSSRNTRRPEFIKSSSSGRRGKWKQDEDEDGSEREYVLEYVKVVGKAPLSPSSWRRRKRKRGSHHENDYEDDDDLHVVGGSSHANTHAQTHLDNLHTTEDDSEDNDDELEVDDEHYFHDDGDGDDDDDDDDDEEDESDASDTTGSSTNNNVPFFIGGGGATTTVGSGAGPSSSHGISRDYFRSTSIEEIERRPTRYYLDRGGPRMRSRVMDKAMTQIYGARLATEMEPDWWRRSSRLMEEKGERWVCREEVWVGCLF